MTSKVSDTIFHWSFIILNDLYYNERFFIPSSVILDFFPAYNPRHPRNLALSAIKGFRNSIEFTAKRGIRIDSILKVRYLVFQAQFISLIVAEYE